MPPFFRLMVLNVSVQTRFSSDVLRCSRTVAYRCSRLRSGLRPDLRVLVLMAAGDSQHTPEHGSRHGQPAGNQAEDCHCKAHHYLHCFRVF